MKAAFLIFFAAAAIAAPMQKNLSLGPCAAPCDLGLKRTDTPETFRATLCGKSGKRQMLECAQCLDGNWAFDRIEQSAMWELANVIQACASGEI